MVVTLGVLVFGEGIEVVAESVTFVVGSVPLVEFVEGAIEYVVVLLINLVVSETKSLVELL